MFTAASSPGVFQMQKSVFSTPAASYRATLNQATMSSSTGFRWPEKKSPSTPITTAKTGWHTKTSASRPGRHCSRTRSPKGTRRCSCQGWSFRTEADTNVTRAPSLGTTSYSSTWMWKVGSTENTNLYKLNHHLLLLQREKSHSCIFYSTWKSAVWPPSVFQRRLLPDVLGIRSDRVGRSVVKNVSVQLLFFKARQSSFIATSSLMSVWSLVLSALRVNVTVWFSGRADWSIILSGLWDWGHLVDKKQHSKHYHLLCWLQEGQGHSGEAQEKV